MKPTILVAFSILVVTACSAPAPRTAWGKAGVSMIDYRVDAGQCAIIAASSTPIDTSERVAGGIHGSNPTLPTPSPQAQAPGDPNSPPGQAADPVVARSMSEGGGYRDSASSDFVNRAAMQQRTQELRLQRARSLRLTQCLSSRGYTEFYLTPEQRAHLRTLPEGSEERREYLYRLGTDPEVLATRAVK